MQGRWGDTFDAPPHAHYMLRLRLSSGLHIAPLSDLAQPHSPTAHLLAIPQLGSVVSSCLAQLAIDRLGATAAAPTPLAQLRGLKPRLR